MIKTTIWGYLAADPELREVQLGDDKGTRKVCDFVVMSNRYGKDKPDSLRVEVWGNRAEAIKKVLKKGSGVIASGDLSVDTYEKDGVKHMAVKLVRADIQFTDKRGAAAPDVNEIPPVADDDLPF